jgi:hypothetical protein
LLFHRLRLFKTFVMAENVYGVAANTFKDLFSDSLSITKFKKFMKNKCTTKAIGTHRNTMILLLFAKRLTIVCSRKERIASKVTACKQANEPIDKKVFIVKTEKHSRASDDETKNAFKKT